MPFPNEPASTGVIVHLYRSEWSSEASQLAAELRRFVPEAIAVEHIGSTSIPGMAAKGCLDMMVLVDDLASPTVDEGLTDAGYRQRPEPWNLSEFAGGREWPKKVFAPPIGSRS